MSELNENTNVGLGMVPCRKGCRCDECRIAALEKRLEEYQDAVGPAGCAYDRAGIGETRNDTAIRRIREYPALEQQLAEARERAEYHREEVEACHELMCTDCISKSLERRGYSKERQQEFIGSIKEMVATTLAAPGAGQEGAE